MSYQQKTIDNLCISINLNFYQMLNCKLNLIIHLAYLTHEKIVEFSITTTQCLHLEGGLTLSCINGQKINIKPCKKS